MLSEFVTDFADCYRFFGFGRLNRNGRGRTIDSGRDVLLNDNGVHALLAQNVLPDMLPVGMINLSALAS